MARDLRLDISGDASRARQALAATEDGVGKLRRETDRLESEFRQANREAAALDRQLLETAAATKALNAEFAKTGDKQILKDLRAQRSELTQITKIRKEYTASLKETKLAQLADNEAAVRALKAQYTLFAPTRVKTEIKERQGAIRSLRKELIDLGAIAGNVGLKFGDAFSGGILGLLKSPGGLAAAATLAIPATIGLGATIGGAIGAGVGGGLAGLSVAGAAAQSKEVHRAWSIELEGIKGEFLSATTPAVEPTIRAIERIGGAVRAIDFDKIFGKSAQFIDPLSKGLARGLEAAGHGIEKFVDNAGPYIDTLAAGFGSLGKAAGDGLAEIGDGSEGGAKALGDFFRVTSGVIKGTGTFIGLLEDAYHGVDDLGRRMTEFVPQADLMARALGNDTGPTVVSRKLSLDVTNPNLGPILDDMNELKGAAKGAADAMRQINDAFGTMFNNTVGVDEAADRYQQSLIDLKKSVEENGTAIEGNSQKALNNRDAIRDVIKTIEEQRQRTIEAGGSTQAAYEQANVVYLQQLQALRTTLVQMHLNTDAVDAMIAKFNQIPKQIDTDFNIHVRIATVGSTTVNGKKVSVGEGGTIPIKGAFAEGGPVPGPTGAPALILAHGGEYVLSNDMLRGVRAPASAASMARMVGASGGPAVRPVANLYYNGKPGDLEAMHLTWLQKQIRIGRLRVA